MRTRVVPFAHLKFHRKRRPAFPYLRCTLPGLAGLVAGGTAECRIADIVDFFAEYISEWNPNKTKEGMEEKSRVAERVNEAHEHTASWSAKDMLWLLEEENAAERLEYYKRAVRREPPRRRRRRGARVGARGLELDVAEPHKYARARRRPPAAG